MNPRELMALFQARAPREQVLMVVCGATLIVFVLYWFALKPFSESVEATRARVDGNVRSISYLQDAAGEAISLQAGGGSAAAPADRNTSPLAALDQTFRDMGLGQPNRIEPLGRNGVRVQFSDVGVDALLRALGAAEQRYGLRVTQLNLNRRQPGLVSARISLER